MLKCVVMFGNDPAVDVKYIAATEVFAFNRNVIVRVDVVVDVAIVIETLHSPALGEPYPVSV